MGHVFRDHVFRLSEFCQRFGMVEDEYEEETGEMRERLSFVYGRFECDSGGGIVRQFTPFAWDEFLKRFRWDQVEQFSVDGDTRIRVDTYLSDDNLKELCKKVAKYTSALFILPIRFLGLYTKPYQAQVLGFRFPKYVLPICTQLSEPTRESVKIMEVRWGRQHEEEDESLAPKPILPEVPLPELRVFFELLEQKFLHLTKLNLTCSDDITSEHILSNSRALRSDSLQWFKLRWKETDMKTILTVMESLCDRIACPQLKQMTFEPLIGNEIPLWNWNTVLQKEERISLYLIAQRWERKFPNMVVRFSYLPYIYIHIRENLQHWKKTQTLVGLIGSRRLPNDILRNINCFLVGPLYSGNIQQQPQLQPQLLLQQQLLLLQEQLLQQQQQLEEEE
jgi:hypothetical protein